MLEFIILFLICSSLQPLYLPLLSKRDFSQKKCYSKVDVFGYVQVLLTPTHLAIVMEYAAGGELFERICNAGRFSEDEVFM